MKREGIEYKMAKPTIADMPDVTWIPGTIVRLKHRPEILSIVEEITSWHAYNTFVWDSKGIHIYGELHYHLRRLDGKGSSSFCGEKDEYEVVQYVGENRKCITCEGEGHYVHINKGSEDLPCGFCSGTGYKPNRDDLG